MNTDQPETLADIVAQMRRWAKEGATLVNTGYIADRIETAAERERNAHTNDIHDALYMATGIPGNAAAMREALHECLSAVTHLRALFCNTDPMQGPDRAIRVNDLEPIADQIDRATAALAAPARNCDRPECADVESAWATYCAETNGSDCKGFARWLFATAEGGDHA